MKPTLPIADCQLPTDSGSQRGRLKIGNQKSEIGNRFAFSLVEVLVVVSLLSFIVLALMSVFSSTQRAFRASVTQVDVLENGRAAVDLMASDLRGTTPSGYSYGGAVNFACMANYNNYYPLPQTLPGAPSNNQRTNLLNYFFSLSRENTHWIGIGYYVDNTNTATLYPLYRYYRNDLSVRDDPVFLITDFLNIISAGQWANTNISHIIDGVVHMTVRAHDVDGVLITNSAMAHTNAIKYFFSPSSYGEAQFYMHSNMVPATVELELGVLEDQARSRAESLSQNPTAMWRYLTNQVGSVHIFRQRVTIPSVDRTAYQ